MMKLLLSLTLLCVSTTTASDVQRELTCSNDPPGFCRGIYGPYADYYTGHSCYNDEYDCKCLDDYELVGGHCCAKDSQKHCMGIFPYGGEPVPGQTCYGDNDYDDCRCKSDYYLSNHNCCADNSTAHCLDVYGPNGEPVPGQFCYNERHDCRCKEYFHPKEDSNWDWHCCANDGPWYCMHEFGSNSQVKSGTWCVKTPSDCECKPGYYHYEGICQECPPGTHPMDGKCVPDGGGFGDPHFLTFHGHEYQFHGECDLVLVKAPSMDMDIHVRTTIRYDYSFISHAAIRLGSHTFEVASWGEYQLDGMSSVDLPTFIEGRPLTKHVLDARKKKYKFQILLDDDKTIDIVSFKDYVAVKIHNSTKEDYADATGLMGHYVSGDMIARDGVTTMDDRPDDFGQEWQVRPEVDGQIFSDATRPPQYPHKCRLPSASAIHARDRRLSEVSVSEEDAKAACEHVQMVEDCVQDVIKTRDLDIAMIYE